MFFKTRKTANYIRVIHVIYGNALVTITVARYFQQRVEDHLEFYTMKHALMNMMQKPGKYI